MTAAGSGLEGLHHVGISVGSVARSLAFWEAFLGVQARWRRVLDGEYLGRVTGYGGVHIDAALVDLPGGGALEILEYRLDGKVPHDPGTAHPGNVHLAFLVDNVEALRQRALAAGATAVSPGPVEVASGPNVGLRTCYLRDPDGITFELVQRPS